MSPSARQNANGAGRAIQVCVGLLMQVGGVIYLTLYSWPACMRGDLRTVLRWAFGGVLLAGMVLAAWPFAASLGVSERARNESSAIFDLQDLPPGGTGQYGWVAIYRRTAADRREIALYHAWLADPLSRSSRQPSAADNVWRSANPEYFVFLPYAPKRGCPVYALREFPQYQGWLASDLPADLPRFMERCDGSSFDQSGRLIARRWNDRERNLTVPRVRWLTPTRIEVWHLPVEDTDD